MAKRNTKADTTPTETAEVPKDAISLTALMSAKKPPRAKFSVWIVGDTPLISKAWSLKARMQMLEKQVKAVKAGLDPRDPEADFVSSLYEMGEGTGLYGFPVTAPKKAAVAVAHKNKGITKEAVKASLYLNAEMISVRPALAGARCDMPLVRVWGSKPEMREDMGKIGSGLRKTAALIYRAQFTVWAIRLTGTYNPAEINPEQIAYLIENAGSAIGIGDWRNEKGGVFGSFHLASAAEEKAWDSFADGKGPLPLPEHYAIAAE